MMTEEINLVKDCFKDITQDYQKRLSTTNFSKSIVYIDDSDQNVTNLLNDYIMECKELSLNNHYVLQDYEKASCLAIAIKNNPYIIVTDKFELFENTIINSYLAIDVALKFCETKIDNNYGIDFFKMFHDYRELNYSKYLLANILEHNHVSARDIVYSFKLQLNLLYSLIDLVKPKVNLKK